MNHPDREAWVPYVLGEAGADLRRRLDEHLQACAECQTEITAWQRSLGRLDAWKLPQARPQREVFQPVLKWAIAAALVLGIGFGFGRLTSPGGPPASDGRTALGPSAKAALAAELGQALRTEWAAEFQSGLDSAQAQTSNALVALEARLTMISEENARGFAGVWTEVLDRARAEDRLAVLALFRDLEKEHAAAYVALRKDLETVASLTDEQIRQARFKLVQLAASARPGEGE